MNEKKKKKNYTRFFHVFVFLEHRNGTGIPFLAINLFWKFGFGEGKKKKNRSEESSTGKSRSKTGMETSIVIKKLATSLSRLIIRIIVVVLSRLRVRSKLFREKKNRKVSYPMVDMPRASISSDSRHFVPRSRTLSPTT